MSDPTEPMPRRPSEPGGLEQRADFRALLARRVAIIAGVLAVLSLLVVSTYSAVAIRDSQKANTPTLRAAAAAAKAAKDSAARIADCTTPGLDCYQRGLAQTSAAVGDIGTANKASAAAAAACAAQMVQPTYPRILACMNATLAPDPKRRR